MRISLINPEENVNLSSRATPYLNGRRVEECVVADEENGLVIRYTGQRDPRTWEMEKETLYGNVEIFFDVSGGGLVQYGRRTPDSKELTAIPARDTQGRTLDDLPEEERAEVVQKYNTAQEEFYSRVLRRRNDRNAATT